MLQIIEKLLYEVENFKAENKELANPSETFGP